MDFAWLRCGGSNEIIRFDFIKDKVRAINENSCISNFDEQQVNKKNTHTKTTTKLKQQKKTQLFIITNKNKTIEAKGK